MFQESVLAETHIHTHRSLGKLLCILIIIPYTRLLSMAAGRKRGSGGFLMITILIIIPYCLLP